MVYCAAFGCNNQARKGNGLSFFSFPKDSNLRKVWTHYCKRWNFVPGPSHRLCSAHFSKDSFAQDPLTMAELGVYGKFQARWSQTPFHRYHWQSTERWKMADPFNFRCQEALSKSVGKPRLVNLCIYIYRFQCNLYLYMCNQLVIILTVNI
jgi:hypothetical protein